jgi:catechol 2,3-dioxygenase-like lactoylglutathione lyase family enzyme
VTSQMQLQPEVEEPLARRYRHDMALHPNGINHLAIATRDIKAQIEYFTDVLGGELKALYWMHGVADTFHGFVELSPTCYIAFQQHPGNPTEIQLGVTHAGNGGGQTTAGTMQHLAFNVDTLDELAAIRDRIRDRGIVVLGPIDHGMCHSIYFAGLEGLALEVTCGRDIDERAWVDPEVQALAGISDEELERYKYPAAYERPSVPVPQPGLDPSKPHMAYPPELYKVLIGLPDEKLLHSVTNVPPVHVDSK